jgi:hypothetical protein
VEGIHIDNMKQKYSGHFLLRGRKIENFQGLVCFTVPIYHDFFFKFKPTVSSENGSDDPIIFEANN